MTVPAEVLADAVLAARRRALEEAAAMADDLAGYPVGEGNRYAEIRRETAAVISAAIRARIGAEAEAGEAG